MKYNLEMMKIESLAMRAFQSDVSLKPELAKELSTNTPLFKKINKTEMSSSLKINSRFGDECSQEESTVLVRGRERALDTIAKRFEKKSKWLERKTAEGNTFYWNKETFGKLFIIYLFIISSVYGNTFQRLNGQNRRLAFFL